MRKNNVQRSNQRRRNSVTVLALGAAIGISIGAVPVATAAPVDAAQNDDVTAQSETTIPVLAQVDWGRIGDDFRNGFDRLKDAVSRNDIDKARADLENLRNQADSLLKGTGVDANTLKDVQSFLKDLDKNVDTLKDLVIEIKDVDTTDGEKLTDVDLTMTNKDGEVTTKKLKNLPPELVAELRKAATEVNDKVEDKPADKPAEDTAKPTTTKNKPKETTKPKESKATKTTKPKAEPTQPKTTEPTEPTEDKPDANAGDADSDKTDSDKTDTPTTGDEISRLLALIEAGQTGNNQITKELLERMQAQKIGETNNVSGKNVNTVQNIESGSGATSVAIKISPDGELSVSAGGGKGKITGDEAASDTDAIINALNKLAEALGGTSGDKSDTIPAKEIETTEQAAQRDRLRRALLALTSAEREANSPESRERDALIMIAQDLKDGKNVNLDDLTTDQMLQVMDWLQNGIPELTKPASETATATGVVTVTATPTTTKKSESDDDDDDESSTKKTTTKKSKSKSDDDDDEDDEKDKKKKSQEEQIRDLNRAVLEQINALNGQRSMQTRNVNNGSGSGFDNSDSGSGSKTDSGSKTGSSSGSGGSSSGSGSSSKGSSSSSGSKGSSSSSGSKSGSNTANTTETPADATAEPTSEELAVTGNSTQLMLGALALLGLIGAGAVTVALRRTRTE